MVSVVTLCIYYKIALMKVAVCRRRVNLFFMEPIEGIFHLQI